MRQIKPTRGFQGRLGYQGLLLVGALLVMELVFLASFWTLLQATEREARREEHAKTVLAQMQKMFRLVYEGGVAFEFYCHNPSPPYKEKLLGDISQITDVVKWLRSEVKDNERERELLAHVQSDMNQTSALVQNVVHVIDTASEDEASKAIEKGRLGLHDLQLKLTAEVQELLKTETQAALDSPIAQRKAREKLQTLLLAAVPLNLILAIFLAIFFTRSITSRLDVLVDNTERLKEKRPLNKQLGGVDEISLLDTTFHEMAASLIKDEALLKEKEESIRKIINSMPVGLVVLNKSGKIEFANPQIEQMFSYGHDELIGMRLEKLFWVKPTESKNSQTAMPGGLTLPEAKAAPLEMEALRKNGNVFPVEVSLTEQMDAAGEQQLLTVVDVTARQEIQRLRQAFVAMVSHELRAPLTSIRGFFSLMDMGAYGELSAEALDGARRAETNTTRLISLISDLIDLEKLQSTTFAIAPKPTTVQVIVKDAVDSVKTTAEQKSVELTSSQRDFDLEVDASRIVQVLVNLLGNAIKFSEAGSQVELNVTQADTFAEFKVIDHGRGIPTRFMESIFEKFQQVKESDASLRGGSGLGLPISKAIIEKHGGTIWVDSVEGKGSTFSFRLPLVSQVPLAPPVPLVPPGSSDT